jgi:hypothetical protein
MDDLSILGGAFNKIKLCNKEISNIKGKGWGKWITATLGRLETLKMLASPLNDVKADQFGPLFSVFFLSLMYMG